VTVPPRSSNHSAVGGTKNFRAEARDIEPRSDEAIISYRTASQAKLIGHTADFRAQLKT